MNVRPILFNTEMVKAILEGRKTQTRRILKPKFRWMPQPFEAGDILWVRETWRPVEASSAGWCRIEYKAGGTEDFKKVIADLHYQEPWHPSIHMPKEAARIFLRVKDVRVERLRNVFFTDSAAILEVQKEGVDIGETCRECIEHYGCPCCVDTDENTECGELDNPRYVFSKLWDSTIKPADRYEYGWAANPCVWVIEFERIEKPEGWCR